LKKKLQKSAFFKFTKIFDKGVHILIFKKSDFEKF
jgi:hypothetical protein